MHYPLTYSGLSNGASAKWKCTLFQTSLWSRNKLSNWADAKIKKSYKYLYDFFWCLLNLIVYFKSKVTSALFQILKTLELSLKGLMYVTNSFFVHVIFFPFQAQREVLQLQFPPSQRLHCLFIHMQAALWSHLAFFEKLMFFCYATEYQVCMYSLGTYIYFVSIL